MKYSLGLDIGTGSVGWAVLNWDDKRIEDLGVRAFPTAEGTDRDKTPLAKPRRDARGARRRLRRRAGRLRRAKDLFVQYGLVRMEDRASAFQTAKDKPSPWQLRAEGLKRILTGEELARALFHIAKHRGFKSNRRDVSADKESKIVGAATKANRERMQSSGYLTAGEMLYSDGKFEERKRNTRGWYENSVDRDTSLEEIKTLFSAQGTLGNSQASPSFEQDFVDIFSWQLPFASGDRILKMVGKCTFIEGEIRAPRNAYHVERANLLAKINSLTYIIDGARQPLDKEQRAALAELAYTRPEVTYADIKKSLALQDNARFPGLDYRPRKDNKSPDDKTFFSLKGYHALRRACEKAHIWDTVRDNHDLMDDLAYGLTFYKNDDDIRTCLRQKNVPDEVAEAVLSVNLTVPANLSLAATNLILPHLENGLRYDEACREAGFHHSQKPKGARLAKLPIITPEVTTNPVVRRALSQARRVVKAVIRKHGLPYRIHIEFAREMGQSRDKRLEIQRQQEDNEREWKELAKQFRDTFEREPVRDDLLRYRLYREQQGKCLYSFQRIDPDLLFHDPNYTQIDHIIPYSRSFDGRYSNKALVLASANQIKLNQTPYEMLHHNEEQFAEFEGRMRALIKNPAKLDNLLRRNLDEVDCKARNLAQTATIAREFKRFLENNLQFADETVKDPVTCINGQITARTRGLWGLKKNREENDLHHAQDAAVLATLMQHQITMITEHARVIEARGQYVDRDTGEIIEWQREKKPRLPQPWKGFRNELEARLSENPAEEIRQLGLASYDGMTDLRPVLVSRMVRRKISGAIHKETIRSATCVDSDGKSTIRKPLASLSQSDLPNLVCKESDSDLFMAICKRMEDHGGNSAKAFAESLRRPMKHEVTRDGRKDPPVVKSVKVQKTQNAYVVLPRGIADNAIIVRTDIYRARNPKGGWSYSAVPVYLWDFQKGIIPTSGGEFWFSIYPFELVRIRTDTKDFLGYYRSFDRESNRLEISWPKRSKLEEKEKWPRFTMGTIRLIEKYEMSVLGEYHLVGKEVRRGLANGCDLKPGETEDRE